MSKTRDAARSFSRRERRYICAQATNQKEKQKKRGFFKPKEPKKMKGSSYQESNETEFFSNIVIETPVLRIPYELLTLDGKTIPIGHYQTIFEKDDNGVVTVKLYQA